MLLEATEREEWHEVTDVKRIGSRIESAVKGNWASAEPLAKPSFVRAISHQPAPLQLIVNRHRADFLAGIPIAANEQKDAQVIAVTPKLNADRLALFFVKGFCDALKLRFEFGKNVRSGAQSSFAGQAH